MKYEIERRIALGTFRYEDFFPDSKHAVVEGEATPAGFLKRPKRQRV